MKNKRFSFFFFCILILLTVAQSVETSENEKTVIFSTLLKWGQETDAQYGFFFSVLFDYLKEELRVEAEYKHFRTEAEFFENAASEGPKFTIVGNMEQLFRMIRDYGYSPAFTYTFLGLEQNRACLYVSDDSGIEDIEGLRGKTLSIYDGAYGYIIMWKLIGGPPEDFFDLIEVSSSGFSSMYLFSLQETTAVLTTEQIIQFMKLNNPGIIKNLRKLGCSEPFMFLPVLHSKDVPESMLDEMHGLLLKVAAGEKLKKYTNIIRFHKLTFEKVGIDDYKFDVDFFSRAEEAGKVKRYRKWRDSLKDEE